MRNAIILAAGKGTRMVSNHCKVMHKVLGEPMIGHIYDNLKAAGVDRILAVVGYKAEEVKEYLDGKAEFAIQNPQLGSGHAVMMAEALKDAEGKTLIVSGDCPLIQPETYEGLFNACKDADMTVLTTHMPDPKGYGRIIRDKEGKFALIREHKDCSEEELKVDEINAGIYCIDNQLLWKYLPQIDNNNSQHEYYFTDIVEIMNRDGRTVNTYTAADHEEMIGINDRVMRCTAERWLQRKVNEKLMRGGVTLIDADSIFVSKDTQIGMDTILYPGVVTEGRVIIGKDCVIHSGCYLRDTEIGDDVFIGPNVSVAPFIKIGNGAYLAAGAVVTRDMEDGEEAR